MVDNVQPTISGLEPLRRSTRTRGSKISSGSGSTRGGSGSTRGGSRSDRGASTSSFRGNSILRGRAGSISNRGSKRSNK